VFLIDLITDLTEGEKKLLSIFFPLSRTEVSKRATSVILLLFSLRYRSHYRFSSFLTKENGQESKSEY